MCCVLLRVKGPLSCAANLTNLSLCGFPFAIWYYQGNRRNTGFRGQQVLQANIS